jgi:tetratricopeptide (TPR) repeat protein
MRGDVAVEPLLAEATALGARADDENAALSVAIIRNTLQILDGDFAHFDLAWIDAKIAGSPAAPAYRPVRSWLLAELGRTDEAQAELDDAARGGFAAALPVDFNRLSAIADWGQAVAALGDAARARELYAIALPYAERPVTAGRAAHYQGRMHHVLGRLAATAGRLADARAHLEAALPLEERDGALPWAAMTRARLAEVLAAAGDPAGAAREAAAAVAAADALGLPRCIPEGARRLAAAAA